MFEIFTILACCCILGLAMYINSETRSLLNIMEQTSKTLGEVVDRMIATHEKEKK